MTNDDKSTHEPNEYPADAMFTDVLNEPCGSATCPFCNPSNTNAEGPASYTNGVREFVGWFA